jgi:hypothetical protein
VIDCETARQLMEADTPGPALQGHLETCAVCREEVQFAVQVAAAIAALPRHAAPDGFAGQVMAAVRDRMTASETARETTSLLLRPWELAGAGVLCLMALAAAWSAYQTGLTAAVAGPSSSRWLPSLRVTGVCVRMTLQEWSATLSSFWDRAGLSRLDGTSTLLVWGCGALAFSVALYLLLSVGRGAMALTAGEDAHA